MGSPDSEFAGADIAIARMGTTSSVDVCCETGPYSPQVSVAETVRTLLSNVARRARYTSSVSLAPFGAIVGTGYAAAFNCAEAPLSIDTGASGVSCTVRMTFVAWTLPMFWIVYAGVNDSFGRTDAGSGAAVRTSIGTRSVVDDCAEIAP